MHSKRPLLYRDQDLRDVVQLLATGQCVAVTALSNFGKSTLLRALQTPTASDYYQELAGSTALFVYVDCNRMLELSPRGFFEATLRAVLEALPAEEAELRAVVQAQYDIVVNPPNDFAAPLAFNNALMALVERDSREVVLLLDEFDEVLTGIEPRILLNLRALRDKYGTDLSYVIAAVVPPSLGRRDEYVAEFAELFAAGKHPLTPLTAQETRRMAGEIFVAADDQLDAPEGDFVVAQAGGHPGLIQAVSHVLLEIESGAPQLYQQQAFDLALATL
ncbi:MAG: ATP-binding protein [Anaerolineae bacterium]|nr:ATP-binding protein [Anaerolineae bacterium]